MIGIAHSIAHSMPARLWRGMCYRMCYTCPWRRERHYNYKIMKIILQKYIAESGYSSRRKAEELIRDGQVTVNGELAELGMRAGEKDIVEVNGEKVTLPKDKIYIILNKPKGYTCTNRQFKNEKSIFELVDLKIRLFTVGRLDKDSEGLVILTNDGDFSQKITHPKFEHEKKYIVEVAALRMPKNELIKKMRKGIYIGDGDGIVRVKKITNLENNKFEIVLTEGKKRQIRRMFGELNCRVVSLKRVSIGNIILGELQSGEWQYLEKEIITKEL